MPPDLQNEVLMSLLETDPDVVDYLLRRKASQWVTHTSITWCCASRSVSFFLFYQLFFPQESWPVAVRGALHPERTPFLQRLQQGIQWWIVPLWQQLPDPEWEERRTREPRQWAALPCPRAVQPGGAGGWLEQRAWSWHLGYKRWTE